MTDLEMTKLCAEAVGIGYTKVSRSRVYYSDGGKDAIWMPYTPLSNDEQALALVRGLNLCIQSPSIDGVHWHCWKFKKPNHTGLSDDLNRAIVECVAAMTKAKQESGEA